MSFKLILRTIRSISSKRTIINHRKVSVMIKYSEQILHSLSFMNKVLSH